MRQQFPGAGPPGFLQVLGERTLAYPEYRGNGAHASLGNIQENPHLGIMLIDFTRARIGLHINGRATIVEEAETAPLVSASARGHGSGPAGACVGAC